LTIKLDDVAKLAGVSKTTVSRVLNNRGYLSEETKKKVNKAMKELNYQPNAVARQLFRKKTNLVGLIFPTVDNPFFGELVAELEPRLFKAGFKVFIGNSMNDPEKEKAYLRELISNQVDGLIVGAHNYNIDEYMNTNLPIVAIDRIINKDIPVISSDNYQGGKLATELLIKRGAKFIVITDGPLSLQTPAHKRRQAYQDVMKAHGLEPRTFLINFSWSIEKKKRSIEKMFQKFPKMDGVFATNDIDAAMVWQTAEELGIEVPADLKIIGYDSAHSTRLLLPKLTTIEQPISAMAEAAVHTLLQRISGENIICEQVLPVRVWHGRSV
jgi:LacI family sucrose operon transcriptional repressor